MPVGSVIRRPVIIVSAPRTGSTVLFETLSLSPDLWTIGGESHAVIEGLPNLHPRRRGWHSNVLGVEDADPVTVHHLRRRFADQLRDRTGRRPAPGERGLRLLEKTPRNALRVPFLASVFPQATFVYLHRSVPETIASMLEGWCCGRYVAYRPLPGWQGLPWSFLLVPGWREMLGRPLPELVARQWAITTRILLDDLGDLPRHRWTAARYDRLVADPGAEIARLCDTLGLAWDEPIRGPLPLSVSTLTPPRPGKWLAHQAEIEAVLPLVAEQDERSRTVAGDGFLPAPG
jgi:hypothetical protein